MKYPASLALAALLATAAAPAPSAAPAATPKPPTLADIVAAAPASDWQRVDPQDVVLIDLANGRRAAFALAPAFAPAHVANIRGLIRAHWFDHGAVYRVQDNYVVQWGQNDDDKAPPEGLGQHLPAEYDRPAAGLAMTPLPYRDTFAPKVGYSGAFPAASDGGRAWMAHCYGIVGVARGLKPDTGSGGELYAVIGQSPRALDRNIALVGRMIDGFEHMTALPRGTGALGFYQKDEHPLAITRLVLAADLPAAERPAYEWLRPDSASFAKWLHLRANRHDDFFERPAGAIDLCNALPPVRVVAHR
ncbi:peptidylprolyl isomerase [Sphingomonas crusticola]|uniref:peptidylprolyl isomerase n=1 Tax=Sphingomonas crusticola TaxID=1697973 RepID=UPI000E242758|nr:peptidylprolyl isomerase [Sphingomonas crusticola]